METLYDVTAYPTPILKMIWQSGPAGVMIANRWMIGWPERVMKLLAQDRYKDVFERQLLQEQDVIARAPNLSHLSPAEIIVMSGLSLEPPEV